MELISSAQRTTNYAIISAECNYYGNKKLQREEKVNELIEKLCKIRGNNQRHFLPENVLILWKSNPEESFFSKKLGHSNDELIYHFAQRVARAAKKEAVQLFIDRPQSLLEENKSIFIILERLVNIWEETKLIPIFLEDDFLSLDKRFLLGKEAWSDMWHDASTSLDRLKISVMAKDLAKKEQEDYFEATKSYYEHFFTSIETLISLFTVEEKKIRGKEFIIEIPKTAFIHTYFMWQAGIYPSVEKAQEALKQWIPISSWYRHANRFEESIFYEEYTIAYWDYLCLTDEEMQKDNPAYQKDRLVYRPKKGNVPDAVEYICFLNKEEQLSLFEPGYALKDPYFEFSEINSRIDVERAKNTAQIQFKNLRNRKSGKKEILEKVELYGYEENDLYSMFSEKSSYYEFVQEMFFSPEVEDSFGTRVKTEEDIEYEEFVNAYYNNKDKS